MRYHLKFPIDFSKDFPPEGRRFIDKVYEMTNHVATFMDRHYVGFGADQRLISVHVSISTEDLSMLVLSFPDLMYETV